MKKFIVCIVLGTLQLFISTVSLHSKSWVCDAKAATGFSNDRGFQQLSFIANQRYVIKDNVSPDQLSIDHQKENRIFSNSTKTRYPASIKLIGGKSTELCIHTIYTTKGFEADRISCETIMYGDFEMNVETGTYSVASNYFHSSSKGSSSWVEVGECRRTN